MRPQQRESEKENIKREIVSELRKHETPLDNDALMAELEISDEQFRSAVSELLDQHRITLTPEWKYNTDNDRY